MNLYKNFGIYFGAEFINKIIPFLLMPILTKYLSPAEFGAYGMYQVILSFMSPFVMMSLQTNITRNFFKVSKEKMSEILSSLLLILHLNVFIVLLVVSMVTIFFDNPLGIPANILLMMPIIIFAQTINTFNLTLHRNSEKALSYGGIQVMLTVLHYTAGLILLLLLHKGWVSLVYGVLFSHVVVSFFSMRSLRRAYKIEWRFHPFREIYAISLPLIFHILGGSFIFLSDRIFIEHILGLDAVGYYTVGSQFGMITMIVINIVMTTISPWIYKNLADNDQAIVRKLFLWMMSFMLLGLIIGYAALVLFPYMTDARYHSASGVILWASMTFVVRGWYQLFHAIIVHEGKTKIFMYISFGSGMLNLVLNYFLIHLNGIVGAIQATLLTFVAVFLLTFYFANKYSSLRLAYHPPSKPREGR